MSTELAEDDFTLVISDEDEPDVQPLPKSDSGLNSIFRSIDDDLIGRKRRTTTPLAFSENEEESDDDPIPQIDSSLSSIFRSIDDSIITRKRRNRGNRLNRVLPHPVALQTIPETNKGFIMLKRMGYEKGSGLGKRQNGIVEPISLDNVSGRLGLGQDLDTPVRMNSSKKDVIIDSDIQNYFVTSGQDDDSMKELDNVETETEEPSWDETGNEKAHNKPSEEMNNVKKVEEEPAWDVLTKEATINFSRKKLKVKSVKRALTQRSICQNCYYKPDKPEESNTDNTILHKTQIISINNKSNTMSKWQFEVLERAILSALQELELIPDAKFPRFHKFIRRMGVVYALCADQFSLDWLLEKLPSFGNLWNGAELHAIAVDPGENKFNIVKAYIRNCGYSNEYILKRIKQQNPQLNVENWRVKSSEQMGPNKYLMLSIDDESLDILTTLSFELFFNLSKINIRPIF